MATIPRGAAELLSQQHSVATRAELLAFATRAEFDRAVRAGELERVLWTVYKPRGAELSFHGELMAAVLRCGPRSRIDGPAALWLAGAPDLGPAPGYVVALPTGRRTRNVPFGVVPDRADGEPSRWTGPIPSVPLAHALLRSAAGRFALPDRVLRSTLDWLRWRGLTTTAAFEAALGDHPRSSEARRWSALLRPSGGAAPESEGERRLGELVLQFRPRPQPQVWVLPTVRVDWYFHGLRLALGYQGRVDHDSVEGRRRDAARLQDLDRVDVRWLPVVAEDLRDPEVFLQHLHRMILRRAAELDVPPPTLPRPAGRFPLPG